MKLKMIAAMVAAAAMSSACSTADLASAAGTVAKGTLGAVLGSSNSPITRGVGRAIGGDYIGSVVDQAAETAYAQHPEVQRTQSPKQLGEAVTTGATKMAIDTIFGKINVTKVPAQQPQTPAAAPAVAAPALPAEVDAILNQPK